MTRYDIGPAILFGLGAYLAVLNWAAPMVAWRSKRNVSMVPFVGPLLMGFALLLRPLTRPYAGVVIFLDLGTLIALPALPGLLAEIWRTKRAARESADRL